MGTGESIAKGAAARRPRRLTLNPRLTQNAPPDESAHDGFLGCGRDLPSVVAVPSRFRTYRGSGRTSSRSTQRAPSPLAIGSPARRAVAVRDSCHRGQVLVAEEGSMTKTMKA